MCNFYPKQSTHGWHHLLKIFFGRWAFSETELHENSWIYSPEVSAFLNPFFFLFLLEMSIVKTVFGQEMD